MSHSTTPRMCRPRPHREPCTIAFLNEKCDTYRTIGGLFDCTVGRLEVLDVLAQKL